MNPKVKRHWAFVFPDYNLNTIVFIVKDNTFIAYCRDCVETVHTINLKSELVKYEDIVHSLENNVNQPNGVEQFVFVKNILIHLRQLILELELIIFNNEYTPHSKNKYVITDTIVNMSVKTSNIKTENKDYTNEYISAIKALKHGNPTLEELKTATNSSIATWSRQLNTLQFLTMLHHKLQQRQSGKYSRSTESKTMWINATQTIYDKILSYHSSKDALSKKTVPYNDNKRISPYGDIGDAYNESIQWQ